MERRVARRLLRSFYATRVNSRGAFAVTAHTHVYGHNAYSQVPPLPLPLGLPLTPQAPSLLHGKGVKRPNGSQMHQHQLTMAKQQQLQQHMQQQQQQQQQQQHSQQPKHKHQQQHHQKTPCDACYSHETYELLVQKLYQVNRFTAVKLGLKNMQHLDNAFGNPSGNFEVVHIAGTNGKGSVAFKMAQTLRRAGYRTGLFVSPHVSCFRERIQVDGQLISEQQVSENLSQIFTMAAQLRIPATFFEITTMLAFLHFAQQGCDVVVLETGLGGRLDATNIITPSLSVITSIGMDHMRVLGSTIPEIAREKAGIIKPGVPVVIGPQVPLDVINEHAEPQDAKVVQVDTDPTGDYDVENTSIAVKACEELNKLFEMGVSKLHVPLNSKVVASALATRPPCRFQVLHLVRTNSDERKVTIVLDVAHNEPAIKRLAQVLRKRFAQKKLRFVCGFSADKDINMVLNTLLELTDADHIHLVRANHPRGATLDDINAKMAVSDISFDGLSSVSEGVRDALDACRASEDDEIVVVCGSVFLMAEARQALGFKEPMDSLSIRRGGALIQSK